MMRVWLDKNVSIPKVRRNTSWYVLLDPTASPRRVNKYRRLATRSSYDLYCSMSKPYFRLVKADAPPELKELFEAAIYYLRISPGDILDIARVCWSGVDRYHEVLDLESSGALVGDDLSAAREALLGRIAADTERLRESAKPAVLKHVADLVEGD